MAKPEGEVLTLKLAETEYRDAVEAARVAGLASAKAQEELDKAQRTQREAEDRMRGADLDLRHQLVPLAFGHPSTKGDPSRRRVQGCEACAQLPPEEAGRSRGR